MMKSFFKKLSLVMALAMVVSMMAPAASAFAADLIIAGQEEAKADAKESYSVEVGKEVDFKFYGAAAGWQDLYKWESADETIAKPLVNEKGEQDGRFEGLKDGEVEVILTIGEQKATVKLVVGKGEVKVDTSYEVKQTAGDKVTVTWADAKLATKDITLYKLYTLTDGVVEVKWPAEVTLKDGVATVDAYVAFEDGDDYVLKFGDEVYGFKAYVGKVSEIVVIPKDIKTNGTTLYACAEDPYRPIRFDVEFITDGDIKVAQPEGTSMYYEVISADDGVEVDNAGECSYITSVGASARIKAIYYYTEDGETKELYDEFFIVGDVVPTAAYDSVAGFAVTAESTKVADVAWGKAELIYGEEAYVALKITDTLKGVYYEGPVTLGDKDVAYGNEFGTITYLSSDESKLLVGEYDGKLTAIGTSGSAVVIVKLTYQAGEKQVTKNIYAFEVALKAERKADKVSATGTTVLVSDNSGNGLAASGKLTFTVVDQYGAAWTNWDKVEITTSVKDAPALTITQDTKTDDKTGEVYNLNSGTVLVDGSRFAEIVKTKTSVTYTINIDGAKTPVTVSLKNPPVVTNSTNVKTTGFLVEATGTDVDGTKAGTINATINAYETWASNGVKYKVGYVPAEKLVAYDNKDFWTKNANELAVGSIVVMVTKPNNEFIVPTINASTGAITVPVAEVASGSALKIEATGTYTVTLFKVTSVAKNADNTFKISKLSQDETTFAVGNKCANMSVSFDTSKALKSDASSIEQVIVDLATFKLGDKEHAMEATDIVEVAGVYNDSADKYYVKSIKVKTPVGSTGAYFVETLTIGKTFEVPGMPDAE